MRIEPIIYIVVIVFASIPFLAPMYQNDAAIKVAINDAAKGEEINTEHFKALYEGADDKQKVTLVKQMILELESSFDQYPITIGPSFSSFSPLEQKLVDLTVEEKILILKDFLKNPYATEIQDQVKAIKLLAEYYRIQQEYNLASQVLSEGTTDTDKGNWLWKEMTYQQILMELELENYEKALKLVEDLRENSHPLDDYQAKAVKIRTEVLLTQHKWEEAVSLLKKDLETIEAEWEERQEQMGNSDDTKNDRVGHPSPQVRELANYYDSIKQAMQSKNFQLASVKGKVLKSGGEPMSNVGVFLREKQDVNQSITMAERYQTRTRADGSFEIKNVIPGAYQFNLGFYPEQVQDVVWSVDHDSWIDIQNGDKIEQDITLQPVIQTISPGNGEVITSNEITFEWEPVAGASYYQLTGVIPSKGGSTGIHIKSDITDYKITVPVEELYAIRSGITSSGDKVEDIHPESLLGFANPTNKLSWTVTAYDSNGKRLTSSDIGYFNTNSDERTSFYVKARVLTEADQLLLDRKHKQAYEAYKKNIEANPSDIHSLRMAIRLLQAFEFSSSDLYDNNAYEKFAKELAKIQPYPGNISILMDYYYKEKQWDAYIQSYKDYIKIENPSEYLQSRYGIVLTKIGKYDEAYSVFVETMQKDQSHRFIGYLLALELLLNQDFDKAIEHAGKYPEREMNAPDWNVLLTGMKHVPKEEVQQAIEEFFSNGKTEFENKETSKFIHALSKVR